MSDKLAITNIRGNIGSVNSIETLDALFANIKKNEPERYARLEASGDYEHQLKVLKLGKPAKVEPKAEEKHKAK